MAEEAITPQQAAHEMDELLHAELDQCLHRVNAQLQKEYYTGYTGAVPVEFLQLFTKEFPEPLRDWVVFRLLTAYRSKGWDVVMEGDLLGGRLKFVGPAGAGLN